MFPARGDDGRGGGGGDVVGAVPRCPTQSNGTTSQLRRTRHTLAREEAWIGKNNESGGNCWAGSTAGAIFAHAG